VDPVCPSKRVFPRVRTPSRVFESNHHSRPQKRPSPEKSASDDFRAKRVFQFRTQVLVNAVTGDL
jgi:hypothetical protein